MRKQSLPVYLVAGTGFHAAVYSTLALLAARHDRRRGWRDGRPGPLNRVGVGLGSLGLALLAWAAAGHHEAAPDEHRLALPDYLADRGAYGVTRNPLYLGGMTLWFGWAVWRGSLRSALVGSLWVAGLHTLGIPFEERMLKEKFGDTYRDYQQRVPRWL